jgi:haloacetate dehalogenase
MTLLAGFSETEVPVNGTTINAAVGGDGPPVLLLHGYPQDPCHVAPRRPDPRRALRRRLP